MASDSPILNRRKLGRGRVPDELRIKLEDAEPTKIVTKETYRDEVIEFVRNVIIADFNQVARFDNRLIEMLEYTEWSKENLPRDIERQMWMSTIKVLERRIYEEVLVPGQDRLAKATAKLKRTRRFLFACAAVNLLAAGWNLLIG